MSWLPKKKKLHDWRTPIPYKELLTKKILAKKQQSLYTREQAIKMAEPYNLQQEVTDAIDTYGLSPDEALQEWDIYPYDTEKI